MKIIIAQNSRNEFVPASPPGSIILNVEDASLFIYNEDADAFIDMEFEGRFYSPADKPLLINETVRTIDQLTETPRLLARFCGWKGFMERPLWEIATKTSDNFWLKELLYEIGKEYEVIPDVAGLVAPRILCNIINEAFYALADGVSTADEIDIAMKFGTNYPMGPMEWAGLIGTEKVYELLNQLKNSNNRYQPHPLLKVKKK